SGRRKMKFSIGKRLDVLLSIAFLIVGTYMIISEWPSVTYFSIFFIITGIILLSTSIIFGINNPHDEREGYLKVEGNSLSYLLTLVIIFVYLMLSEFDVVEVTRDSAWIVFFLCLLVMPLTYWIKNKR